MVERESSNGASSEPDSNSAGRRGAAVRADRRDARLALAVCVAVQLLCDVLQVGFRGGLLSTEYVLIVAGLTLALAVPIGLLASLLPNPLASVLGLWAFTEFFLQAPHLGFWLIAAVVLGAVTWLGLRSARPSAIAAGLGLAACLWVGLVAGGPLFRTLPAPLASLPDQIAGAIVYVGSGAALVWNGRARLLGTSVGIAAPALTLAALLATVALRNPAPDLSAFERGPDPEATGQPNLLVVVLDTVRADHVSLYGYERATTPELERWAEQRAAAVYPRAYSPSNWTAPAHLSLFTGALPSEHQAHCGNQAHLRSLVIDLPETLAERVASAGYRSAAVIANPNAMSVKGTGRGFDSWRLAPPPLPLSFLGEALRGLLLPHHFRALEHPLATARMVNAEVLSLLDQCEAGGCLVVANYIDVHAPFHPPTPFAGRWNGEAKWSAPSELHTSDTPERVAQAMAAYDEELLGLDAALGELFTQLETRGFLKSTWVFVTSDHGEAFLEHDSVHHASSLYDEQIRIPLVIFYPDGSFVESRNDAVGLLDVTATVSAIATGQPLGRGRDLRDRNAAERSIQAEFYGCPHPTFDWGPHTGVPARAVVRGDRKLLEIDGRLELYALDIDPGERRDRSAIEPDTAARLSAELPPLHQHDDRVREPGLLLDARNAEALRALGYIE